jgi:class 3 adenylate cyclase
MEIERQRLLDAIAAQENLRGSIGDAVIDATIAALREKLSALEERDQSPKQQRKQVTTLFTDIVDSTHIIQHLDPEDVRELFESILEQLAQSITHYEEVSRAIGRWFGKFGAPTAREDDP